MPLMKKVEGIGSFYEFTIQRSDDDSNSKDVNNSSYSDPICNQEPKSSKNEAIPIYPHSPVKVFHNMKESRMDIIRDFKKQTIIYMLFNKITGKVYIGTCFFSLFLNFYYK